MTDRPEWVKCINDAHLDNTGLSWCGCRIETFEFSFVDIGHAAMNGRNGGRLVACPECVSAICEALRNGQSFD
jgi:hypothetical protein